MIARSKGLIRSISTAVNLVGTTTSIVMMFIVTADVALRYLFKAPIRGAEEMSEILLVLMVYLGLASVQSKEGHIRVEQFVTRMSTRPRLLLEIVLTLLGLAFFVIMVWRTADSAIGALQSGSALENLGFFSTFPIRLVVSLGVFFFCLELLLKLVLDIGRLRGRETS